MYSTFHPYISMQSAVRGRVSHLAHGETRNSETQESLHRKLKIQCCFFSNISFL